MRERRFFLQEFENNLVQMYCELENAKYEFNPSHEIFNYINYTQACIKIILEGLQQSRNKAIDDLNNDLE